jgi:hypothetical protein
MPYSVPSRDYETAESAARVAASFCRGEYEIVAYHREEDVFYRTVVAMSIGAKRHIDWTVGNARVPTAHKPGCPSLGLW